MIYLVDFNNNEFEFYEYRKAIAFCKKNNIDIKKIKKLEYLED